MKPLSMFLFLITYCMNCKHIVAQFEAYENGRKNILEKLCGLKDSDEAPMKHNFFSSVRDNYHSKQDVVDRNDGTSDYASRNGNINIKPPTSDMGSRTSLRLESKLTSSNEDSQKSRDSIISNQKADVIWNYEIKERSSTADYNIFDFKSTGNYQTESSVSKALNTVSDQSMMYKNITILIIDENNNIRNKISVPILNTSHIIIKAHSNNMISNLLPEISVANRKSTHNETAVTEVLQVKSITNDSLERLTNTPAYSRELYHSEQMTVSTSIPLIRNFESSMNDSELNKQHNNEVELDNKSKARELHEQPSLKSTLLKIIEDHNEKMTSITANSTERFFSTAMNSSEQQSPALVSQNILQVKEAILNNGSTTEVHSNITPATLDIIKDQTDKITYGTSYSLEINTMSTSEHNDLKDEIPTSFISLNEKPKEALLSNKPESGNLSDMYLSLKPAILEIIEENTDRNKNVSSKNRFVNVYVPTLEYTRAKSSSEQTNEQGEASEDNKIENSGKPQLMRNDSSIQKAKLTITKNRAKNIGSVEPRDSSKTNFAKGSGPPKLTDSFPQLTSVESGSDISSQMKSQLTTSSSTTSPFLSDNSIDQSSSSSRSLDTNALIKILWNQYNRLSSESFDQFKLERPAVIERTYCINKQT